MKNIRQLTPDEKNRGTELVAELTRLIQRNRQLQHVSQALQILMREKCILLQNTPTEMYVQFPNSPVPQKSLSASFIAFDLIKLEALVVKERAILSSNNVASRMTLGFINPNSPNEAELEEILDRTLDLFQKSMK